MTLPQMTDIIENHMFCNAISYRSLALKTGYGLNTFRRFIRGEISLGIVAFIDHCDALGFEVLIRRKK